MKTMRATLRFLLISLSMTAATMLISLITEVPSSWSRFRWFGIISFFFASYHGWLGYAVMPRTWIFTSRFPSWMQWPIRFLALIATSLIATPAALATVFLIGGWPWSEFFPSYRNTQPTAIIITLFIGGSMTVYHFFRHRLEQTTLELRTKQLEHERALKLATEAQLASLESRLHPHFLFNTINSISSLIREDPVRAERMLGQMAALLRFSLDAGQTPTVPLSREMKIVRDYLEIERARFGDRLSFHLDVPEHLGEWPTPPMSIQTLVENSIKHAIASRREGGEVRVAAANGHGRLRVEVTDDGPGFDQSSLKEGHGLDTLQKRFAALYGPEVQLEFTPKAGMTVAFELPETAGAPSRKSNRP